MRFARGPILARAEAANLDGRWHRANVESELCLERGKKFCEAVKSCFAVANSSLN
jgi:hypothetical protein